MLSDREKGKVVLISASVIFLYYTLWVIAMFMSHSIALFVPAISGLIFIGGLTIFTIYHIRLHLNNKAKNR
ncbi:unnamed protein product [Trichogramma brassicae]|uniref:Dolichol phosphate-mannose biosynthesis regulatory protein n=1 Tax=Trichogramma brassicae TaxID=86971 RepID=A0A6H5HZ47_9HYME|nr:unnamed protein product [Trichogramma brassicae]